MIQMTAFEIDEYFKLDCEGTYKTQLGRESKLSKEKSVYYDKMS